MSIYDRETIEGLTHDQKVMLYAMGSVQGLKDKGLVTADAGLSPKGMALYDQLEASGFQPSRDELTRHIAFLGVKPTELGTRVNAVLPPPDWSRDV